MWQTTLVHTRYHCASLQRYSDYFFTDC